MYYEHIEQIAQRMEWSETYPEASQTFKVDVKIENGFPPLISHAKCFNLDD